MVLIFVSQIHFKHCFRVSLYNKEIESKKTFKGEIDELHSLLSHMVKETELKPPFIHDVLLKRT